MIKSVFTRYMLSFILIFVVGFAGFGAVIYGFFSEYARNELLSNVQTSSYSTKIMLDKMYENYFTDNPEDRTYTSFIQTKISDVDAAIQGVSKFTDIGILLIAGDGTVCASTAPEYLGKRAPAGFFTEQFTSDEKITLGELITKKSYLSAVPLSGQDGYYVLSFNLVDSDDMLLGKLLQALGAASILLLVLGVSACYFISYRMITPLKQMSKAAKKFAMGDFSARVPVQGKDEIAELAGAFNNMAQSLSDLEEQRSLFLANVSHDLRTPMTSISGFIDGILDGTIPPENHEHYLRIVSTEINRLSRLVRTLLELTRIEAGVRKFTFTEFDLCEMAMMILFSFEKQIDEKELQVDCDFEKDHLYVKADSDAIYQVLYNLIDNAVKFSFEHGVLRLKIEEGNKQVFLQVYNEGIGISSEDLPHVFDRFYKADKSRGKDKTGVGLGLFIVKAILQAHGENITCQSEEGKYCSFRLSLPKTDPPSGERRKRAEKSEKQDRIQ